MCVLKKHNQFQFFGVFQIGFFLSVIWCPDLYFMLTCWPEPANEDICKDSTEASFKILQSKSRGSCCHPQSLHQGICKWWWWYMVCSRFRWNQWFQWNFGVHLILYGWNLFFSCLCPCPHKLLHVSILFKLKNMGPVKNAFKLNRQVP